jgi:predicted ATPase/DNA-binding CsgD family transcriptional regulator
MTRNRVSSLPTPLTTLVGRQAELAEIPRLLARTRLLTLTGAGGMGKTRVALEVARALAANYSDGAELVELAAFDNPHLVPQAVATVLGVAEQPGRVLVDVLADALRTRRLLLVLDNCEHVIGASAELAQHLLQACPELRILATSREPLGLAGETVWRVPPLAMAANEEDTNFEHIAQSEAVRLFADRAASVLPGFALTERTAPVVGRVCRRLDGIPLALELAAARVAVLSVEQLAERLDNALELLTAGSRTAPARQQTLLRTLDWSYALLTELEQRLFDRLAVFAGGWTLEAAEAVCAGEGIQHKQVLDLLAGLVHKSLVVVERSPDDGTRYRLLEPIRRYAQERLGRDATAETVRRRHAEFFLMLAERIEPALFGPEQRTYFDRLERELDNVRSALDWNMAKAKRTELGLRLASALWWFWILRGHVREGCDRLTAMLARTEAGGSKRTRAKALFACGALLYLQADADVARNLVDESVALWRDLGDQAGLAWAQWVLALNARHREPAMAVVAAEESLARFREVDAVRPGVPQALWLLGTLARAQGDYARADTMFHECLAVGRAVGDPASVAMALLGLGGVCYLKNDLSQAVATLRAALACFRDLGIRRMVADCFEGLAATLAAAGSAEEALRFAGAATALRERIGAPLSVRQRGALDRRLAPALRRLSETAAEAAWQAGRSLAPERAIAEALDREPLGVVRSDTRKPANGLTAREREVAAMIARGLSNRAIAESLVISHGTAHRHVANILEKLDQHSRSQIAVWAIEHGLGPQG